MRDLEFNLFEVLDLEKALATGEFGDLDGESVREMLAEAARLAQGPLAESFADGDRSPPEFDPESHAVRLPESFKSSVRAWQDAGWPLLGPFSLRSSGSATAAHLTISWPPLARDWSKHWAGTIQRGGAFYRGKVAAAVCFAETVLPRLATERVVIESQGLAAMELDEEAF